jgi:hypothetical protein
VTRDDDVRTLLTATADATPVSPDLLGRARDEARRVRRRRWVRTGATGGTALATVGVLLAVGTQLPTGPRPEADPATATTIAGSTASADVPPPEGPAVTTPVPGAGSVSPAPSTSRPPRPSTSAPSPGPAAGPRFGPPAVADSFDGGLDQGRWTVYPSGVNSPLSVFSAAETAVRGGALELSVHRPGGSRPYTTGGVGGLPIAREYGRFTLRMRMTAGTGVIGQVGLVPAGSGDPS